MFSFLKYLFFNKKTPSTNKEKIIVNKKTLPKKMKLDKNKLKCRCGCQKNKDIKINPRLEEMIAHLEQVSGTKFMPSSGYRCPKHNKAIGGAKKSIHLHYPVKAVDGRVAYFNAKKVYKALNKKFPNSRGIGYYEENDKNGKRMYFSHFDGRIKKSRWLRIDGKYLKATTSNLERYGLC